MNSLNLRQIDGGNVIKQADFGSNLSFELLDERRRKIPELDGQTATIRLIKGDNIVYQTEQQVVDGTVSFKFDRVLEKGIYVLEIVADNYVFPSNNMVKITIEKTAGNYTPENMIKTDLVELQGKITAIEQREHDVNQELLDVGQKQAEMTKRIETLEQKQDNDTIYDDSELVSRVTALENKPDKDTIYNDAQLKEEISKTKSKVDSLSEKVSSLESKQDHDTIYDDSEIKRRITALEQKEDHDTIYDDTEIKERLSALEKKEDKDTIYNDTEIKQSIAIVGKNISGLADKVTALEERPIVDTALTERVEALERKEDRDTVYDDSAIVKRIETLEQKEDKDTIYNDTEIKNRLVALEQKEDKDTVYDDRKLVERIENLESDDTAIKERISALEDKPDKDTIYDDSSLKAQVSELQEKLKSLNTVRRAPTGYTLDRTTTPWTIWFDNGCGMTMPQYGTMASVYGYGQEQNAYNKNLTAFPLPPIIMSVSHGTLTVEKIKTIEGCGDYWSPSITIINPVSDREDYDWANARFNKASLEYAGDPYYSYKYVRQQYFIRTMYELGIWSGEIVEEFGATKK